MTIKKNFRYAVEKGYSFKNPKRGHVKALNLKDALQQVRKKYPELDFAFLGYHRSWGRKSLNHNWDSHLVAAIHPDLKRKKQM